MRFDGPVAADRAGPEALTPILPAEYGRSGRSAGLPRLSAKCWVVCGLVIARTGLVLFRAAARLPCRRLSLMT